MMGEKHHQAPNGRVPTANSAAKGVDDDDADEYAERADVAPTFKHHLHVVIGQKPRLG